MDELIASIAAKKKRLDATMTDYLSALEEAQIPPQP